MYVQNIVLPKKGETYKFNSHAATEKAGLIVFCDFEASLEKIDNNDGKTISVHRLMAYKFVIINSKDDKVLQNVIRITNDPNLFLEDIFDSIKPWMEKYKQTCNSTIYMT